MGYQPAHNETVQKSIRRIAREQIDKAIGEIDDPGLDQHEAIHQVRKRCKKLRALVRLVRPALGTTYQNENGHFRDIARRLSGIRDEQSMVEALERLQEMLSESERSSLDPVREKLQERRDRASDEEEPDALLAEARKALKKARARTGRWRLEEEGFAALGGGFVKTYKRGRKACSKAYRSGEADDFHEWRKRVKYHMHHVQLLRPLWPTINKAWRKEAKALADVLGDDHDLALLDELLTSEKNVLASAKQRKHLHRLIGSEQQRLREEAWLIGQRLYAEKPKALTKRWEQYWQAWQAPVR